MTEKKTEEQLKELLTKDEAEKLVLDLAKKGLTSEKIGQELKNKTKEKIEISSILRKNNLYKDPEMQNIKARIENLRKHFEKNKGDKIMKKALLKAEAKMLKISKE